MYEGDFKEGNMDGMGVLKFTNESVYDGEF